MEQIRETAIAILQGGAVIAAAIVIAIVVVSGAVIVALIHAESKDPKRDWGEGK